MSEREKALETSLRDILSRFHSCIADGNGELPGDAEAIQAAQRALALEYERSPRAFMRRLAKSKGGQS